MTEQEARRNCPKWASESVVKVYGDEDFPRFDAAMPKHASPVMKLRFFDAERFKKRYGILLVGAFLFVVYSILLISITHWRDTIVYREYIDQEIASGIEAYKTTQAQEIQASYWVSGDASREAFLNQQIELGAHFIAEETGDTYKCTKLGCAMARVLNAAYPNSLEEVVNQPSQWVRYSADNTITQHDLDLAEKLLRPFYEQNIVPNGLSEKFVYFNDQAGVARDTWDYGTSTHTWTYQG